MRAIIVALILCASISANADFADDQYPDQPDVLYRIVTAAENDDRFKSKVEEEMALYLRRAEYIGPLRAPFGTVHVAKLFYIRSARKGTRNPARGHTYILFLDRDFKIRDYWLVDDPDINFRVQDQKLLTGEVAILDYARPPQHGTVLCDGKVVGFPQWK